MFKKTSKSNTSPARAYALRGRIVTMKHESDVIDGKLYVRDGRIAAIIKDGDEVPANLQQLPVYPTGGTIFPGLIELHNHLSYNCLPLWKVPERYSNRSQWAGIPEYRKLISGPMFTLGKTPGYPEAIVRYVECKCLVAGVTTSQGIMLYSNQGISKYYRGVVRNVEETNIPGLPKVDGHIPDIASKDAAHFLKQLKKSSCMLLHLSEGNDQAAHKHFEALKIDEKEWAITDSFAGIHCVALNAGDYAILKEKGGSMVWSPLSNLLLYGTTADVKAAKESGLNIGIGSDWSSSGSKNLLGELKVAKLYSKENNNIFSDFEILSMATSNAARIIKWDKELGTLEVGKRADLLVVDGAVENAYGSLLSASEKSISLVVIDGIPRYGLSSLMQHFGGSTEKRDLAGSQRAFNLFVSTGAKDPLVGKLTLSQAEKKLKSGLKNLKKLAAKIPLLKKKRAGNRKNLLLPVKTPDTSPPEWFLLLDQEEAEGQAVRLHLPLDKQATMLLPSNMQYEFSSKDLPASIKLDSLTVVEDEDYFKKLDSQNNLPDFIKINLRSMYKDIA